MTVATSGGDGLVRIALPGVRIPHDVLRALDDTTLVSASSIAGDLVAGRALVESVHGNVSVHEDASAASIEVTLRKA